MWGSVQFKFRLKWKKKRKQTFGKIQVGLYDKLSWVRTDYKINFILIGKN